MKPNQPRTVTPAQLAAWCGCHPNAIYRRCRSGEIPAERVPVAPMRGQPPSRRGRPPRYEWRIPAAAANEFADGYFRWRGTGYRRPAAEAG